jgi:bifunctional DNA-binding transcriptional regulator/antitoxin component of YhaV-PrlF toxin-antitoxin module
LPGWFERSFAKVLVFGKILVMKTSVVVDEVGRLVLPKDIREAIGVFGRMPVNIEVVGQTACITAPEQQKGAVSRKRGRLVYAGSLPENWDSGEAVLKMRERRVRR